MNPSPRINQLLSAACILAASAWAGPGLAESTEQHDDTAKEARATAEATAEASGGETTTETRIVINGEEIDPADAHKHGVHVEIIEGNGADIEKVKQRMQQMLRDAGVEGIDLDHLQPGQTITRVVVNGKEIDPADAPNPNIVVDIFEGRNALELIKQQFREVIEKLGIEGVDLDQLQPGQTITRVIVNGKEIDPADAHEHGVTVEAGGGGSAEAGGGGSASGTSDAEAGHEGQAEGEARQQGD